MEKDFIRLNTQKKYYSASEYYKDIFGCKVYKISISSGCTCPNRDGTKSFGGCIFCSNSGSGEFTQDNILSIEEQINKGKQLVEKKLQGRSKSTTGKYLAYFQNFTNTYGKTEDLVQKYKAAINQKDIVGLVIATRPDCLSQEILNEIAQIAKDYYVSIELGLQTSNEKTAYLINRQYELSQYDDAIKRIHLANQKIHVVTHLIFGLPDETEQDMMNSVRHCILAKTDGLKFTVLFVLKNTKLEQMWRNGQVSCLTQEEYFNLLKKALDIIPQNIVIHRLTGDGDKQNLLSPLWTSNKRKVLNDLNKFLS